jgi:hypothetical protein
MTRESMKKFGHNTMYNAHYAYSNALCTEPPKDIGKADVDFAAIDEVEWHTNNDIDLSELPAGTYTIDSEGLTGEYGGITVEINSEDDIDSVTAKIAEKLYGKRLMDAVDKVGEKINETDRGFLEVPKDEGGKDNADEHR